VVNPSVPSSDRCAAPSPDPQSPEPSRTDLAAYDLATDTWAPGDGPLDVGGSLSTTESGGSELESLVVG